MATDFGTDISVGPDGLSETFELVSGRLLLAQAIANRLSTERGTLAKVGDDAAYGLDIIVWLNEGFTPQKLFALRSLIAAEARKDERVLDAQASVSFDQATRTLAIKLALSTAFGPFRLTLGIDNVSVTILSIT